MGHENFILLNTTFGYNQSEINSDLIQSITNHIEIYQEIKNSDRTKQYNLNIDVIVLKSIEKLISNNYNEIKLHHIIHILDGIFYYDDNSEMWEKINDKDIIENTIINYVVYEYTNIIGL